MGKKKKARQGVLKDLFIGGTFVASETSYEAAQKIETAAPLLRERIYECIKAAGADGLTDADIARFTGINPSTARPRRVELVAAGRVVKVGTSKTSSGRKAATWGAV